MKAAAAPGPATIITLAAIAAMGSMAIHMLVPALPLLAHEMAAGEARAQQAVSVYLAGLAGGQLIAGPLADRLGRRPVMLWGLACYIAGALGAALSPAMPILLAARLLQALGGAAGVVSARVIVGELYGREEAAARQATLMSIVLISPALAPVVGGVIADFAGWRTVFLMLAATGLAGLVSARMILPAHTPAVAATAEGTHLRPPLIHGYARLFRNRRFVLTTAALAASSGSLYMFLGAAPFLLIGKGGLSPSEAGIGLLIVAGAGIVGTRLMRLVQRRGDAVVFGTASAATGAISALLLAALGFHDPFALLAPITLLGLGAGLTGPAAISEVAYAEAGLAATATSLAGALQMLASSLAMTALGLFAPLDSLRVCLALALSSAVGLTSALLRRGNA